MAVGRCSEAAASASFSTAGRTRRPFAMRSASPRNFPSAGAASRSKKSRKPPARTEFPQKRNNFAVGSIQHLEESMRALVALLWAGSALAQVSHVTWTLTGETEGNRALLHAAGKVDPGWHLYS